MPTPPLLRAGLLAGLAVCLLGGCGDPGPYEITEVRELDEVSQVDRQDLDTAQRLRRKPIDRADIRGHGPAPSSSKPAYEWALPEGWSEVPVRAMQMRDASFEAPGGVDVSLLVGPPSSLVDNVNRWRGFMGAEAPIDADGVSELAFELPSGRQGVLVDLRGTYTPRMGDPKEGQRFLGFLLGARDHLLSVRMLGPESAVDAAEEDLRSFLRSLERKAPAVDPHGAADPHGAIGPTSPAPAGGTRDGFRERLVWDEPDGWTAKRESGGMRIASFRIEGAPRVDVPLIAMGGDGGGLEAITGMWAGNIGADMPSKEAVASYTRVPMLETEAVLVEIEGEREVDGKQSSVTLYGLACFLGDRSLFLRMQGRTEDVTPHKEAFIELGRSLRLTK